MSQVSISDADRKAIEGRGWNLSEEEVVLLASNLQQMRISTVGCWSPGECQLQKVNRFDVFGKAGLRDNDVIVGVDGAPLTDERAFALTLSRLGIGAKPTLQVRRGEQVIDVTVELLKKNVTFEIDEVQVTFERKLSP